MIGLATLPQVQAAFVVIDKDGRPQEDLMVVHCFGRYGGSGLNFG